jgi:alpha-galactosidase
MQVCPKALFLNYTNPMAMLAGYMQRYTDVKTVGLCHKRSGLREPSFQIA